MKLAILLSLVFASAASADTVMDDRRDITTDCATDKEWNLVGNHITLRITGSACAKVSVTGNHITVLGSVAEAHVMGNNNTLTLDAVDLIKVLGNKNTVTYRKPLAKPKTTVGNVGRKNKISVAK